MKTTQTTKTISYKVTPEQRKTSIFDILYLSTGLSLFTFVIYTIITN